MRKNNELTYRLAERGIFSLSDSELIEIATGTNDPDKCRKLLSSFNNNLREIARLSLSELISAGLTKREANILIASLEIGRRKQLSEATEKPQIKCSKDIFDIFQPILGDLAHEEFWVIFLNRSNRIMGRMKLSQGGISGTVTDVRVVMKRAIEYLASGIIVAHNHPSGNLNPSESDTKITQKIKEAGNLMDIQLLDHLIITDKEYYSFADNGLL
jgi:DNA repair protein RadC